MKSFYKEKRKFDSRKGLLWHIYSRSRSSRYSSPYSSRLTFWQSLKCEQPRLVEWTWSILRAKSHKWKPRNESEGWTWCTLWRKQSNKYLFKSLWELCCNDNLIDDYNLVLILVMTPTTGTWRGKLLKRIKKIKYIHKKYRGLELFCNYHELIFLWSWWWMVISKLILLMQNL